MHTILTMLDFQTRSQEKKHTMERKRGVRQLSTINFASPCRLTWHTEEKS